MANIDDRIDNEPAEPNDEPQDKSVTVDLDAVDDNDQGQEPQQQNDRRSSYKRLKENYERDRTDWTTKQQDYERRMQEYDRQLAELRGSLNARPVQQQAQQPDQTTQAEQEIAYWEGQMDQAIAAVQHAAPGTPANILEQHRATYKQAQRQMYAAIARAQGISQTQQPQQQPNIQAEMLRMNHPKIFSDDALRLEAQAEAIRLMRAKNERALSFETASEANERVYQRHGLSKKQTPPNESDRQKLVGTNGKAGASGGTSGNTLKLSQREIQRAISYYADTPHANKPDEWKIERYAKRVASKPDAA